MGRFRMKARSVAQSTGGKGIIGFISFVLILWIVAFFPAIPIPFSNGLYFYLFPQDMQFILRAWLYFLMFVGFQIGVIGVYVYIGKFFITNWNKVVNLPKVLDKKLKRVFK